jgi:hypothetical protein
MESHQIQIGEPWDFEHQNGTNAFGASFVGIIDMSPKENWQEKYILLDITEPFQFKGELVSQILCCPRYEGDSIFQAQHLMCTVGISRVLPGITYDINSKVNPEEINYFAIGEVAAHNKLLQRIKKASLFSTAE